MKKFIFLLTLLFASLISLGQKPNYEIMEMKAEVLNITSGVDFAYGSMTVKVSEKDTLCMRFAQRYGELMVGHFKSGSLIEFKAKVNTNAKPKLSKEILFYFFQDEMLGVKLEGRWIELESESRVYGKLPYKVFLDKKVKDVYFRENDKWALLMEGNIIAFAVPFFIRNSGMKNIKAGDAVSFIGTETLKLPGYVYPVWDAERVFSFIQLYKNEGTVTSLLYKQNYACIGLVLKTEKETLRFSFPSDMGKQIKGFVEKHPGVITFSDNYKLEGQLNPPELHALVSNGDTLKIERFGFYGGEDVNHDHKPAAIEGKINAINRSDKGKVLSVILGNDCYIEVDNTIEKQLGEFLRRGKVINVEGQERIKNEGEVYSKDYRIITPQKIKIDEKVFLIHTLPQ